MSKYDHKHSFYVTKKNCVWCQIDNACINAILGKKKKVKDRTPYPAINEVMDLAHKLLPFQLYLRLIAECEKYVKENK